MKVIIAGTRTLNYESLIAVAVQRSGFFITEVFCGDADGIDSLGAKWAKGKAIPVRYFPVSQEEWDKDPYGAGHARNLQMVLECDALIAIWDGESGGTANVIREARRFGKLVHVYRVSDSID